MSKVFVSGLINIETTVSVNSFPVEYSPIDFSFFGIESTVSGVGTNISFALKALGDDVVASGIIGNDENSITAVNTFKEKGIGIDGLLPLIESLPQSVVLYDSAGRRKIYCDLKNIQETQYNESVFKNLLKPCSLAILCNINFNRHLLKTAKEMGKLIATDVHVLSDINDEFNKDFMQASDILFLSDELIPCSGEEFIDELSKKYDNNIIVIGMGEKGALLYEKGKETVLIPAAKPSKIVSTVGAGDALFSSFLHFYLKDRNAKASLEKAVLFAAIKIGAKGAGEGFVNEEMLLTQFLNKN